MYTGSGDMSFRFFSFLRLSLLVQLRLISTIQRHENTQCPLTIQLMKWTRSRHVKCTEEKPQCARCVAYGTSCPGYPKRAWIFDPAETSRSTITAHSEGSIAFPKHAGATLLQGPSGASPSLKWRVASSCHTDAGSELGTEHSTSHHEKFAGTSIISKSLPEPDFSAVTTRSFQYFCENTLPMLLYVNPSPAANYVIQHLMPQAFQAHLAVKHAIVGELFLKPYWVV